MSFGVPAFLDFYFLAYIPFLKYRGYKYQKPLTTTTKVFHYQEKHISISRCRENPNKPFKKKEKEKDERKYEVSKEKSMDKEGTGQERTKERRWRRKLQGKAVKAIRRNNREILHINCNKNGILGYRIRKWIPRSTKACLENKASSVQRSNNQKNQSNST